MMMRRTTSRRWGTLLVLVGGLLAPIGTAMAQDHRDERRDDGQGTGGWQFGRQDRDQARRWRAEERARRGNLLGAEERARQESVQQRAAEAERARRDFAARRAAEERARQDFAWQRAAQERARQEAVRATWQRDRQRELAWEQAQIERGRQRAARREAWISAMRERREARFALQRQRRVWFTVNQQAWVQWRGQGWSFDAQMLADEHRVAVRNELRRHARRDAYLERLRAVAAEVNEPEILWRVGALYEQEQLRHQRRMDRLGAATTLQGSPYGGTQYVR